MRILLVNPGDMPGEGAAYGALSNPIMGLAYIATYLQKNGFEVEVLEMSAYQLTLEQVKRRIAASQPAIVGITAKTFNILSAYQIADLVKSISKDIFVILGGAHPTALVENTLSECHHIDAIVRGEGEGTFLAVCKRLEAGYKDNDDVFSEVEGLTYVEGRGNYVHNPDRPLIRDLDSLPFPDFSLYDLRKFGKVYDAHTGRFDAEVSIFASRGCPFKCRFCMPLLGRMWRYRSPENVVAEIDHHWRRFGIRRFAFNDSTFGINRQWFHDLCNLLRDTGLHRKIHWLFETRADLASQELLEDAVSAGASAIFFGFESGSDTVLTGNDKGITRADILKAVTVARQAGIPTISGSFIFGLPYETKETVEETLELISELGLDFVGNNIVSVYPGTELWDMVDRGEGGARWLPDMRMNWRTYDRTTCQIEVNDLTAQDIRGAFEQAKTKGMHVMKKRSLLSYAKKSNAYFWYHLRYDRRKLLYYLRWGLRELLPAGR